MERIERMAGEMTGLFGQWVSLGPMLLDLWSTDAAIFRSFFGASVTTSPSRSRGGNGAARSIAGLIRSCRFSGHRDHRRHPAARDRGPLGSFQCRRNGRLNCRSGQKGLTTASSLALMRLLESAPLRYDGGNPPAYAGSNNSDPRSARRAAVVPNRREGS